MNIYLVEDCANAPGRIIACFADKDDAVAFMQELEDSALIEERTLIYGQAPVRGYNP